MLKTSLTLNHGWDYKIRVLTLAHLIFLVTIHTIQQTPKTKMMGYLYIFIIFTIDNI